MNILHAFNQPFAGNDNGQVLPEKTATRFVIGRTYSCRSICDYNCIFSFKVIARTAKQVTLQEGSKLIRRGIKIWEGVETCEPYGRYSMSPVLKADKGCY